MSNDLDQLVDLALFARVVEGRSFTAAAQRSGIAKSAVSRRVSLLEKRLGVQLLRRTTRSISVTAEGLKFYEHCAKLLESARAAADSIRDAVQEIRGKIRVSAPVTFAQMHLAPALSAFLQTYPEAEIQLVTEDRFVDLTTEGFELVIRIARLKDASSAARRLATDRLVIVGTPDYLQARGYPASPEELVHHNCLHYELVPRAAEWRFRRGKEAFSPPTRGNLSATDGTVLRQAALSGLGLVVLPFFMVSKEVATGRLELVLSGARRAEIGLFAVFSSWRGLPLRVRALLEHLSRWFREPEWLKK
jgi:DNA-binding transcriptional LysR family regulator